MFFSVEKNFEYMKLDSGSVVDMLGVVHPLGKISFVSEIFKRSTVLIFALHTGSLDPS